jgi:hypothetical protein
MRDLFQTIAMSGFPHIALQLSSEPAAVLFTEAQIPGPPTVSELPAPRITPSLFLAMHSKGLDLSAKCRGSTIAEKTDVRLADLETEACDFWKKHGVHKSAADLATDDAILKTSGADSFADIQAAVKAVLACKRAYVREDGAREEISAMSVSISVL